MKWILDPACCYAIGYVMVESMGYAMGYAMSNTVGYAGKGVFSYVSRVISRLECIFCVSHVLGFYLYGRRLIPETE